MTTLTAAPTRTESRDRMNYSRIIGSLFLAGFLTYGIGYGLVDSIVGDDAFLSSIPAHETILALGVFLMMLNTLVDVGKAVAFFPIVEQYDKRTALIYLSGMIVEVVLMTVGGLALLMLIPLAGAKDDTGGASWSTDIGNLAVNANDLAYQTGQFMLAAGALFLVALLYRTGLVPRWLAGLGLVGYATHLVGAAAELFGLHLSLFLLIPGACFEIGIALWLIIKGFDPVAYRGPRGRLDAGTAPAPVAR
jgi:hypothetical protein